MSSMKVHLHIYGSHYLGVHPVSYIETFIIGGDGSRMHLNSHFVKSNWEEKFTLKVHLKVVYGEHLAETSNT